MLFTSSLHIHLCSGSPRRLDLLLGAGVRVTQHALDFDEQTDATAPLDVVRDITTTKLATAIRHIDARPLLVADTIVHRDDGRVLGKPTTDDDAKSMLSSLAGAWHSVTTAYGIRSDRDTHIDAVTTRVRFFALTESQIADYVATGEPRDKAGAYGIQGMGRLLVDRIDGSYTNVVGLPVERVVRELVALRA